MYICWRNLLRKRALTRIWILLLLHTDVKSAETSRPWFDALRGSWRHCVLLLLLNIKSIVTPRRMQYVYTYVYIIPLYYCCVKYLSDDETKPPQRLEFPVQRSRGDEVRGLSLSVCSSLRGWFSDLSPGCLNGGEQRPIIILLHYDDNVNLYRNNDTII